MIPVEWTGAQHNGQHGHGAPEPSEVQHGQETQRLATRLHQPGVARLVAVGVGGAGTNAVNRMIEAGIHGVEFLAMNTDAQALELARTPVRLQLGDQLTRGLGAGGNPEIGHAAAEESYGAICEALAGADMVFVTAGMGGGTGTGASPLVAQAAREQGALTVAIVTTPFAFERRRKALAEQGIAALRQVVDALIVVPNERLMQLAARDMSVFEAYRLADDVLRQGIQGISDLIVIPGLINLDFADIRAVMTDAGSALMSIGQASGENRAEEAARSAITNPLLEVDINGARGVVFNITGGDDLTMYEVHRIADVIAGAAHPDANIIFGTVRDPSLAGSLKVTVVATGFEPRVAFERAAWPRHQQTPFAGGRVPTTLRSVHPVPLVSQPTGAAGPAAPSPTHGQPAAPAAPPSQPPVEPFVRVAAPIRMPGGFGSPPAARQDHSEPPAAPSPSAPYAGDRSGSPPPYDGSREHDAPAAREPLALGYLGEEFVENDEPEEAGMPQARHGWERFLNLRR
jgi:cell division protein FtsZ